MGNNHISYKRDGVDRFGQIQPCFFLFLIAIWYIPPIWITCCHWVFGVDLTGFGVTTNNTLITGYFNKMKGHEAPVCWRLRELFGLIYQVGTAVESWDGKYLGDVVQSITGVIWLVKDGKVFVDESQEWEDLSIQVCGALELGSIAFQGPLFWMRSIFHYFTSQQTGSKFCTIQSARAALGMRLFTFRCITFLSLDVSIQFVFTSTTNSSLTNRTWQGWKRSARSDWWWKLQEGC